MHEEELIEDSSMEQTNLPDVNESPLDPSATREPSTATTTDGNTGLVKKNSRPTSKKQILHSRGCLNIITFCNFFLNFISCFKSFSSYNLFTSEIYPELKRQNPGKRHTEINKMIAKKWLALDSASQDV